ncbi:undecaprenyl-diphosphate phosphatase [bacterium]|nr:undecaprenyl-diphosphate phosphatase [bacterium]
MSFYLLLGGHVTAFWYFLFKYTNLTSFWPLWLGFMITGILLASLAWCEVGTRRVNVWRVAVLGCVQGLALLPGVSRFATVFVVSRWLGLPIRRAVAITFALQFPLQMAAGLRGVYHFFGADCAYVLNIWMLLGMMLAIAGAYWLLWYMVVLAYTRRLYRFSWYMLMPIFFSMMLGL